MGFVASNGAIKTGWSSWRSLLGSRGLSKGNRGSVEPIGEGSQGSGDLG